MPPLATVRTQLGLLIANICLIKKRSWKTSLSELLVPILIFFAFQSPSLSRNPKHFHAPTENATNAKFYGINALGLSDLFQASPIFPPLGPFNSLYVPQKWSPGVSTLEGGPGPTLLYAPNTLKEVAEVMDNFTANCKASSMSKPLNVIGLADEEAVVRYYESQPMKVWAAIVFYPHPTISRLDWSYAIRVNGSFAPSSKPEYQEVRLGRLGGAGSHDWLKFYQSGFALLQYCVDQAILVVGSAGEHSFRPPSSLNGGCSTSTKNHVNSLNCSVNATVGFVRQPSQPDHTIDSLWIAKWLPGWCLNVASVFWLSSMMLPIVSEHQQRVPMRVMGMLDISYQLAWFIVASVLAVPLAVCFTEVWYLVRILEVSSFGIVTFYLYLYLIGLFSFAFFLAPAVKSTDRVSMLCFLVLFVTAFIYVLVMLGTGNGDGCGSGRLKLALSVLCPFWSGHVASELIKNLEDDNLGVTLDTWNMNGPAGEPSFLALIATTLGSVIMFSLAAPVTQAACSEDDSALRTLLIPRFCRRLCAQSGAAEYLHSPQAMQSVSDFEYSGLHYARAMGADTDDEKGEEFHEPLPAEMRNAVCAEVRNLTKVYATSRFSRFFFHCCRRKAYKRGSSDVKAVDGLCMDLCVGQIFSLLGHNGAGKTTTISIMSNSLKATAGDVTYHLGYNQKSLSLSDVKAQRLISKQMGMCPQHNILWNQCSPREHLRLFARLKGVPSAEVESSVETLLTQISLPPGDEDRPVGTLSGGNQRKTSLGIALVGDPLIVFLDEPTAGMDPASRRKCWEMLQRFKKGRCIVLCTHFMDEADILGDRIAIMCKGKMAVSGSSLFLKHHFGRGYIITLTNPYSGAEQEVINALREIVPGLSQLSSHAKETKLCVPLSETSNFQSLLRELERCRNAGSIRSFTLKMSTLEDCFLEVARKWEPQETESEKLPNTSHKSRLNSAEREIDTSAVSTVPTQAMCSESECYKDALLPQVDRISSRLKKHRSTFASVMALCNARFLTLRRSLNAAVLFVGVPLAMVILGFAAAKFLRANVRIVPAPLALNPELLSVSSHSSEPACVFDLVNASLVPNCTPSPHTPLSYTNALAQLESIRGREGVATFGNKTLFEHELKKEAGIDPSKRVHRSCGGVILNFSGDAAALNFDGNTAALPSPPAVSVNFTSISINMSMVNSTLVSVNSSLVGSMPIMLNQFANAIGRGLKAPVTIHVKNHPLPYRMPNVVDTATLFLPMFVGIGFLSVGLGAIALVADRETKRRHVLRLIGVSPKIYVAANLAFDLLFIAAPLLFIGTILIFALDAKWFQGARLWGWFALGTTGPISAALFSYVCSHVFQTEEQASRLWPMILPASTVLPFIVVFVLHQPDSTDSNIATGNMLSRIFTILPNYSFQDGLQRLMLMQDGGLNPLGNDKSKSNGGGERQIALSDVFSYSDGILLNVITNVVWIVVGTAVCILLETGRRGKMSCVWNNRDHDIEKCEHQQRSSTNCARSTRGRLRSLSVDSDVAREEIESARVIGNDSNGLVTHLLCKTFVLASSGLSGSKPTVKRAVKNLSLSIPEGELFCLLGPNGAGKSTTMGILTTEQRASKGTAAISGFDVSADKVNLRKASVMGVCPQFDPLYGKLTVQEHLELFCTLQGISSTDNKSEIVQESLRALDLERHRTKQASQLSGGNKRKLSVALALLGDPRVILLDEPSTGVDVVARRKIWTRFRDIRQRSSVLLSTHAMEEALALHDRIGVMVNGRLVCIGSASHLQAKFGAGFTVEISAVDGKADSAQRYVCEQLGAVIKERYGNEMKFSACPSTERNHDLADIFKLLEINDAAQAGIRYFAVAHTSLEEVFLRMCAEEAE